MTIAIRPEQLDLSQFLKPGGHIVFGQAPSTACPEPVEGPSFTCRQAYCREEESSPSTSSGRTTFGAAESST